MVKRKLLVCLFFIFTYFLYSENQSIIKLSFTESVSSTDNHDGAYHTGLGEAEIDFLSTLNRNMKSELSLRSIFSEDDSEFEIYKAYIKARMPGFRLLVGKTRLSWGEGFLFNSGDVIYGSSSLLYSINNDILRDETTWLNSVFIPIDTFSFIETIISPESMQIDLENEENNEQTDSDRSSAGARYVTKINNTKIEGGYYFNGIEKMHKPYISFQGHYIYNWHLSASTAQNTENDTYLENFNISAGIYNYSKTKSSKGLNTILEALIYPDGYLEQKDNILEQDKTYFIFIYPQLDYNTSQLTGISLRSILSPIDMSALWTAAFKWYLYQGFTVASFISIQTGEDRDIYNINNENGLAFSIKFEFIF